MNDYIFFFFTFRAIVPFISSELRFYTGNQF